MEAVRIRWAILLASSSSWLQLSAISILPSDSFLEHSRTAHSASLVAFVALAEAVIPPRRTTSACFLASVMASAQNCSLHFRSSRDVFAVIDAASSILFACARW